MNRRALLKALPAAVVAGAAPAAALYVADPAETLVMRLFREWEAEDKRLNGPEGIAMPQAEFDVAMEALDDLSRRLMAAPVENAQDMVAKVLSWTSFGGFELPASDQPFWAEARAMVAT